MAKRRNAVADLAAYLALRALIGICALLPWRARLALGGWIGRRVVALPRLRGRIEANLRHVFPDMTARRRSEVAREVGDSFGRTFIELLDNRGFLARRAFTGPTGPGAAALEAAFAAGTGAVVVTGHFGQYEAVRAVLRDRGIACAGVFRPIDNPRIDAVYRDNLQAGGPVFPKGRTGIRGMVGHLARGGFVGILTDQYDHRGVPLDFVGRPAPTSLAAAELALRYNLPLVPAYGVRAPDGEHIEVVTNAPIPHTTAARMMQAVNDSLAARVRQHPGQYYWLHRRWAKHLPAAPTDPVPVTPHPPD